MRKACTDGIFWSNGVNLVFVFLDCYSKSCNFYRILFCFDILSLGGYFE